MVKLIFASTLIFQITIVVLQVTEVTIVPMVMDGMARGTLMKPLLNLVLILMLMLMDFMVSFLYNRNVFLENNFWLN